MPVNKALKVDLVRNPLIAILGMKPDITFNRKRMYILQIILIAAKKAITLRWLKQDPPTKWLAILRNIYTMCYDYKRKRLKKDGYD